MKLAAIADRVARDIYTRPIHPDIPGHTVIRDACDGATYGDLSCSMLDRLCDMVHARLHGERFWRFRHEIQLAEIDRKWRALAARDAERDGYRPDRCQHRDDGRGRCIDCDEFL